MAHSNQIREFILSGEGISLQEAYLGPEGVLTGSARVAQQAKEKAARLVRKQESERRSRDLARRQREIGAQIEVLQAQLAGMTDEGALLDREGSTREDQLAADRVAQAVSRQAPQSQPVPIARLKKGRSR